MGFDCISSWSLLIFYLTIISSQSPNLGGRRGITGDVATMPFRPSLSSTAHRQSLNSIPVHFFVLSYHLLFCLPLLLVPSLSPAELSSPCQRILRCGHTIWVTVSLPWLGDHHAQSGFYWEPLRSSHGLCIKCLEVSYSISSQGLGSFSRFLDLKLRKHIADDKDRIYKWKGALTKVEMIKDRVDHKPHLSLLSLSYISWTFIFNFRNDDLPRNLGNRALFGQNII